MANRRFAAVMAGGSGERFWPISRKLRPKQLLKLPGAKLSMLGETLTRLGTLFENDRILILTTTYLAEPVNDDTPQISETNVLAEPMRRNTAGALVWLVANLLARGEKPEASTLAVLPADHWIESVQGYQDTLSIALDMAETTDSLVTVGIKTGRPETGYGYVEAEEQPLRAGVFRVKRFHEKPSYDLAREYVKSPHFYWNSGMFFWRLSTFLNELSRKAPAHREILDRVTEALAKGDQKGAELAFSDLPDISIDYLLMERASSVTMVEARFAWDDLGSWDAMARYMDSDTRGNASSGDNVLIRTADCVVLNESEEMTTCVVGVYGVMVVVTDDAILICDKNQAQAVRDVVTELKERGSKKL